MKTLVVTLVSVTVTVVVAALTVLYMGRVDPSEQIYKGTYLGLSSDDTSLAAANPAMLESCCSLMWRYALLDADDSYKVPPRACKKDQKSRNCTKDCASRMWTSQGCKACCEFKEYMGVFNGRPSNKSLCKKRCRKAYACRFEYSVRSATNTCGLGSCRHVSSGHKCVESRSRSDRNGYCECIKDVPRWLQDRF